MGDRSIPKRAEQKTEDRWAVEDLYASGEAWAAELAACAGLPGELAAYEGRLGESAATLLEYLDRLERDETRAEKLFCYSFLKNDEDTADAAYQAMRGRAWSFIVKLDSARSFAKPELVAIPDETLARFFAEEPKLEKYRRYLERARLGREHILSPAEEALLSAGGEVASGPSEIFAAFANADMRFPDAVDSEGGLHRLTNGSHISLMESSDRALREDAFKKLYGAYGDFKNTLASTLNAEVKKNVFLANARRYSSALEGSLAPDEIPVAVYHNLIEAVHANLDKMYRYMELRRRLMGLDELHMYDIYAPMTAESGRVISFEQARRDVLDATSVLGERYSATIARSFTERWMDKYENEGKRSGAYSMGTPVHPFVLLNHKDTLDSEFTLAHELGHAMHSYLSREGQPPIYSDYVIFVAEVASTCNEALLMQYLLARTTDRAERAVLITHFLEQFRTTLYRQTMFAEFELRIHERVESGESLTADELCKLYYELNRTYYGEGVTLDPEIALEWSRIPHFYRYFYVFQYATGFSAAMALSKRILTEGAPAVADYLRFLSSGCATDPVSLLKIAGVDMSTPEPVSSALTLFGELIDELAELMS